MSTAPKWWQKKRFWALIVVIIIIIIVLINIGYNFGWTGFGGYSIVWIPKATTGSSLPFTRLEEQQPAKTLWDWLQLLIIPLVIAIVGVAFDLAITRTEQRIARRRYENDQLIAKQRYEQEQQIAAQHYEQDQKIALDKQREDLLQAYLDRMSELLLDRNLRKSVPDDEVRNVARVRTITVLFQLDTRRIGYVFAFLRETGLMSSQSNENIVSLSQSDLRKINLSGALIYLANLSEAILNEANLSKTFLYGANLSDASLRKANLNKANLSEADLSGANLSFANLSKANLSKALQLHLFASTLLSSQFEVRLSS